MIREVMRDENFLAVPSEKADAQCAGIADDLLDTLKANAAGCVGMAANMIGERKAIIVFDDNGKYSEMFNPVILKKEGKYQTEEGCLSLKGTRRTERYRMIRVQWMTRDMKIRTKRFDGWTAQIIQHEIDHINGIII